ncbi:hypothetical protein EVG20_g8579 [Dentipellis fragilis]|uniref:Uncharacterized protein n=1 Tax=Dentipellis fragilis TaxID=205917 RepID=A0A4Y9Y5E2_9AGAM|nr:hypothetical protein EVG20_g8579 [Dentipellis fragilis]
MSSSSARALCVECMLVPQTISPSHGTHAPQFVSSVRYLRVPQVPSLLWLPPALPQVSRPSARPVACTSLLPTRTPHLLVPDPHILRIQPPPRARDLRRPAHGLPPTVRHRHLAVLHSRGHRSPRRPGSRNPGRLSGSNVPLLRTSVALRAFTFRLFQCSLDAVCASRARIISVAFAKSTRTTDHRRRGPDATDDPLPAHCPRPAVQHGQTTKKRRTLGLGSSTRPAAIAPWHRSPRGPESPKFGRFRDPNSPLLSDQEGELCRRIRVVATPETRMLRPRQS